MKRLLAMREGGKKLGAIRLALFELVDIGVTPKQVEAKAMELIEEAGGKASFAMVPRYQWATCVCVNEEIVHGVPSSDRPFQAGDIVMVDVGIYYKKYHTDCAFTKPLGTVTPEITRFLEAGKKGLGLALEAIKPGARIGHLSQAMGDTLTEYGYFPAAGLTGHGIGKKLHQDPMIPCSLNVPLDNTSSIKEGQTLAIEIIYTEQKTPLHVKSDGWTLASPDGTISAVFEETVEVTSDGYLILTQPALFQR